MNTIDMSSLRLDPGLVSLAEEVLEDRETLAMFVEQAVRAQIERRHFERPFIERGLASQEELSAIGEYYAVDEVLRELDELLAEAES